MPLFRGSGVGAGDSPSRFPEVRLRDVGEWESVLEESRAHPVLVFKHSTACDISSHVLDDFRRFAAGRPSTPVVLVHVIEDRSLSDAIAKQTGIRHESPQVIAIRDERPIWHASHWSIDLEELSRRLAYNN